jgi:segregation and condensation protein A
MSYTPSYQVQIDSFEGPLDLLLQLIEKEKLSITQVSLAQVADQYLVYIENRKGVPLSDLASFLGIAAKLLLIKSRALLPILTFTENEEEAIMDLQIQLELYALFKEAAKNLGGLFEQKQNFLVREKYVGETGIYYPPGGITASSLEGVMIEFLGGIEKEQTLPEETLQKVVSLEKRIVDIQKTLAERGKLAFHELTQGNTVKEEIIVSFLALLELVKQKIVTVTQEEQFASITIEKYT